MTILAAQSAHLVGLDGWSWEMQGSQDGVQAWIFSGGGAGTTLVTLEDGVYHAVHQGRQNFSAKNIFVFWKLKGGQRIVQVF